MVAGLTLLAAVSWIFGIMMAVAQDLPALESRQQYLRAENSVVRDITGKQIATLTNNDGLILVESHEIAASVKQAVVAIEDQRFYQHRGVDYLGIARALYEDVLAGSAVQGGSTITQQFVKNALAAQQSRTVFQKLRESALAYHLEREWSKDKILTQYLNTIYFGEGAYGIEAAAQTYFGWNHPGCGGEGEPACSSQLLPHESALLAGVISSPDAYSPRNDPGAATERRDLVLQKMAELGYLSPSDLDVYTSEPPPPASEIAPPEEESEAPYFTSWLRQQIVDKYGAGEAFGGGLEIVSTLDLDLQEHARGVVDSYLAGLGPSAAVVAIDNETGGVRAMIGGAGFSERPFNLATNGQRQPGSAFKPFTLVTALEQGRSTEEVFPSQPVEIPFEAKVRRNGRLRTVTDIYEVSNYEDSYLGSASLATATTYSDNSVYAQLGHQVGEANIARTARKMGIDTPIQRNPAMILGGLEVGVTPMDMAHAYETLAKGGLLVSGTMAASPGDPVGIAEVTDGGGDLVPADDGASGRNEVLTKRVISAEAAETAVNALESVVRYGTGTNAATGELAWGKTGTTDDNGDAWFCGATERLTACVWVGHAESNEPMLTEYRGQPVDGGTYPALIWRDIMIGYEEIRASREAGEEDDSLAPQPGLPSEPAPEPEAQPAPSPEEGPSEPEDESQAPQDSGSERQDPRPAAPQEDQAGDGSDGSTGGSPVGGTQPQGLAPG